MPRPPAAALLVLAFLTAIAAVPACASPAETVADGEIVAREVFRFPAYADAPAEARRVHSTASHGAA
jgi:hypothetical protein